MAAAVPDSGAAGAEPFRVTLAEPAELPICLLHVGSDGAVLAGLDGQLPAVPPLDVSSDGPADDFSDGSAGPPARDGWAKLDDAGGPLPDGPGSVDGFELAEFFEGTLDPAATVRALSDTALCQLADALYRHLDTSSPSFGAHTWYELATEELQNRKLSGADGPAEGELAAGQAIA